MNIKYTSETSTTQISNTIPKIENELEILVMTNFHAFKSLKLI